MPPGETYANLQIRKSLQQVHLVELTKLTQQFRKLQLEYEQSMKVFKTFLFFFKIKRAKGTR
jgi:hypothetical protein